MKQNHSPSDKLILIRRFSRLLDSQFSLFGTHYRFGIDPLMNFIPVVGSFFGFIASSAWLILALSAGASGKVLVKMILNISIDYVFGSIPILGYFFDFAFKANDKNFRLLEEHFQEGKHSGTGIWYIIGFFLFIILLSIGFLFLIYKSFEMFFLYIQKIVVL